MENFNSLRPRGEAPFDFYPYNPSNGAGWTFVVLFAIGSVVHLAYIFLFRAWFFIPFVLGCIAETGGYYGRVWAHDNRRLGDPYVLQLFLIIGATPLLSASIYMSLSRLINALEAVDYSIVRVKWISRLYILIDIACLALQIAGTVMQAYGGSGAQKTAVNCVAGGLIFQLIAFVIFALLALQVHLRLSRESTPILRQVDLRWKKYFWVLYISSTLILIRNLVRILEFLQGSDGVIASHEVFLYIFDACPMFSVVLLFAIVHPGRLTKEARRIKQLQADEGSLNLIQHHAK